MDVKIVSTGEPFGTRILGPDGSDLSRYCSGVEWIHDAGELPRAVVRLSLIELEVDARARFVAPNGKAVRRIEYEDGAVDEFSPTAKAPAECAVDLLQHGDDRVRRVR